MPVTDLYGGAVHSARMDERREHARRPQPPLHVRIGGKLYMSHDWSEGNLLLDSEHAFGVGALVTIDGVGLTKKTLAAVEVRGRVERVAPDGGAAVNFLHRDDRAASALRDLMEAA